MATAQCVLLLAVHILLISEFILANGDYYEILGVPKEATERQIKKAFHKLALKYHPDRNRGPNAEAKFREIAEGKPLCPYMTIGNYKTVKFKVNFIVNLSVFVYRRRDQNTVSHNPEYNFKKIYIYIHTINRHICTYAHIKT